MAKNLYVGNLSYDTTADSLQTAFEEYGEVVQVNVITDRNSGRPRGFAFVEMATDEGARAAIAALDGQELDGRTIRVNEAKPREPHQGGDRGGRGGRSGGRGGSRRF